MNILISGASGFIGKRLCEKLSAEGHNLIALSRNAAAAKQHVPQLKGAFYWDPVRQYPPIEAFDNVNAVIHLAGESVAGRWTANKKKSVYDSRIEGTRHLVEMMNKLETKPKVFISASAIGYYGDRSDEQLDESSPAGDGFMAEVCKAWEAQASQAHNEIRTILLRVGIVLGPGGGALKAMLLPAKLGTGGPLGSGKQWWSWIHINDVTGLISHAIVNNSLKGPLNATAPSPVRQKEFSKALGNVLHRPAFIPSPAFAIRWLLGEFSSEVLNSKRVLPKAALDAGYAFLHPQLDGALKDVLQ